MDRSEAKIDRALREALKKIKHEDVRQRYPIGAEPDIAQALLKRLRDHPEALPILIEDAKKRIGRTLLRLLLNHDFWAIMGQQINWLPAHWSWCPTAATTGTEVYYDPAFVAFLDDRELAGLVLHELYHVAAMHPVTSKKYRDIPGGTDMANIAQDAIINSWIESLRDGDVNLPEGRASSASGKKFVEPVVWDSLPKEVREGHTWKTIDEYRLTEALIEWMKKNRKESLGVQALDQVMPASGGDGIGVGAGSQTAQNRSDRSGGQQSGGSSPDGRQGSGADGGGSRGGGNGAGGDGTAAGSSPGAGRDDASGDHAQQGAASGSGGHSAGDDGTAGADSRNGANADGRSGQIPKAVRSTRHGPVDEYGRILAPKPVSENEVRGRTAGAIQNALASSRNKDPGSLPGEIQRVIEELTVRRVDWKRWIRARIADIPRIDRSYARPGHRTWSVQVVVPGPAPTSGCRIGVVFDTSGSMSETELADCCGTIVTLVQELPDVGLTMICVDTEVHRILDLAPDETSRLATKSAVAREVAARLKGGGGTSFTPAFEELVRIHPAREYAAVVFFTDGYPLESDWGTARAVELGLRRGLFVVTDEGTEKPGEKLAGNWMVTRMMPRLE